MQGGSKLVARDRDSSHGKYPERARPNNNCAAIYFSFLL
jgi:hypothetical protein